MLFQPGDAEFFQSHIQQYSGALGLFLFVDGGRNMRCKTVLYYTPALKILNFLKKKTKKQKNVWDQEFYNALLKLFFPCMKAYLGTTML